MKRAHKISLKWSIIFSSIVIEHPSLAHLLTRCVRHDKKKGDNLRPFLTFTLSFSFFGWFLSGNTYHTPTLILCLALFLLRPTEKNGFKERQHKNTQNEIINCVLNRLLPSGLSPFHFFSVSTQSLMSISSWMRLTRKICQQMLTFFDKMKVLK